MTRNEAEIKLKELFGFDKFYDLQWEVIDRLFSGKRVLFIEKTGYGKSLCFQFPATQMQGVTIVFSPLIALMRDQVRSMIDKGIRAAAVNSNQTPEENAAIIAKAQGNQLDILYIAPERMENAEWITAAREMKIAMVVIDEAHCISVWGQSFRPNYRRIVNLVRLLPKSFPVLAATATATPRVQEDIIEQVGSEIIAVRGRLLRHNIRLFVVKVGSEDEKYYWLAEYIPRLIKAGNKEDTTKTNTGIVYTGTQANTDIFSNWLQFLKISSTAYSGRLDAESRKRIEDDFMNNKYDCVVSTNALGMGIDNPDIRFIVHTQIPQSPIHYYQEIGRAGRDEKESFAVLLYNKDEADKLPKVFIEGSKPLEAEYEKVIAATKKSLMGLNEIIRETNLKLTHVRVILADLEEQGIINEQLIGRSKKYFHKTDAPKLDLTVFDELRKAQNKELEKMLAYTEIQTCRMQYLFNYLGDGAQNKCGICDLDKNHSASVKITEEAVKKLKEFRETYFPLLEVETQHSNVVNGVAASYYGISNIGNALHHSKYENGGDFPEWIIELTVKAFKKHYGDRKFDLIVYVPPTESGNLVKNFAEKISLKINVPVSHNLGKNRATKPQKIFQSAISKKENVKGKFCYGKPEEIIGKNVLLIDDIFDSGCTIKEIGRHLTEHGANLIASLVIAKTVGGDI